MEGPCEEKRTFYVYGFWHIGQVNQYVTKDGKIDIAEFDNIEDALAYMKEASLSNVNITWSLIWDKYFVEHKLKV